MSKLRWHLGHLDSLRGISVLGVVLVHSVFGSGVVPMSAKVVEIAYLGQRGVQLFFVVSAFTLFLSAQNRRNEASPTRNFFLRRFFRLAPMFYLATVLTRLLLPQYAGTPGQIAFTLTFLQGLSPTAITKGAVGGWSVADEALFYLCLPLLFRWVRTIRQASAWLILSMLVSRLLIHVLVRVDPSREGYYAFSSFIAQFPMFLCGVVAFFIWRDYLPVAPKKEMRQLFPVLFFCVLTALYVSLPSTNENMIGVTMLIAAFLLLVSLYPAPLLVNAATRFLGKISFSVYLLHFFFMDALWKVEIGRFAALGRLAPYAQALLHFFATLALTVPVAFLTWRYIEEPGIRLGRRLIDFLEGRSAVFGRSLVPPIGAASQVGNSSDAQF